MATDVNPLKRARVAAGLSQIELARRAGISRQALSAIETDSYQPGVGVALALARELGRSVEALFGEEEEPHLSARLAGHVKPADCAAGTRVSLARVGSRLVAAPVAGAGVTLTPAAGIVGKLRSGGRVEVAAFRSSGEIDSTLVVMGCDPAVSLMRDYLGRRSRAIEVVAVPSSSRGALEAVAAGDVHVAGVHLRDPKSGDYNFAAARQCFGSGRFTVVHFARWELGLAMRPRERGGAPAGVADLARPGVSIINREPGAGARLALDEALEAHGIAPAAVNGYERLARGHLEVAAAIANGLADAGVTIRLAAELYGLAFHPWREERYDFIVPAREIDSAPVQIMMEALNSGALAREISGLCSYDTKQMGEVVSPPG